MDHLGQIYDARPVFGAVAENTTSQPAVTAFATNFRHQRTCSCTPRVRENSLERERPRGLKSRSCSSRWARAGQQERQAEATEQSVREIWARRRREWVYQCGEREGNVHLTSASAVLDGGLVSWNLPLWFWVLSYCSEVSVVLLGVGLALLWLIWYWVPGLSALLVFMGSVCGSFCWSGVPAFIFEDFCSDFWLLGWSARCLGCC